MHIVLNSFGASIGKKNGLFEVSTAELKQIINPVDVKTITVSKGARISSDAVLLAIEEEVDVLLSIVLAILKDEYGVLNMVQSQIFGGSN